MANPLTYLEKRGLDNWIVGEESHKIEAIPSGIVETLHATSLLHARQLFQELTQLSHPPTILLAEPDPVRFIASFIAATAAECPIFLCNPAWVKQEWQQVLDLAQPDIIWGNLSSILPFQKPGFLKKPGFYKQKIMIPTGGTSGKIRFAIHTWETLIASVKGVQQYFQLSQINSFCVLPLYHVSGLMQFMRSLTTGGRLVIQPFKALENGEIIDINPSDFLISLVPTQLQRLLQNPETSRWLSDFKAVLLGGAPPMPELLEIARQQNIPLAPTYGMTETASQIVTLKPEEFLAGNNSSGRVLPHAKVTIRTPNGEILGRNQTGIVTIEADSLALNYYPKISDSWKSFQPDDLGFFDNRDYLTIVGRSSDKIITGGENVFPSEVEAAIFATDLVSDVCVIGTSDRHWGQVVTAVYVPRHPEISLDRLQAALEDKLAKFKRPKYWVAVENLPRNSQGKVNREKLLEIVQKKPGFSKKPGF